MSRAKHRNVLVLGGGLAGLSCALEAAKSGAHITIVTKSQDPQDTNTSYAQGGIAHSSDIENDGDQTQFAEDILESGDGTSYAPAVEQLARLGGKFIDEILIGECGVPFDRSPSGELLRGREAAHSKSRILHFGDSTGKAIAQAMYRRVREFPNIEFVANHTAVDLLTTQHHGRGHHFKYEMNNECCGAYLMNNLTGEVRTETADCTVLATGGVGQLFLHSTNSPGATGDGMVMAKRAGAAILFPHYIQFHPTALFKGTRRFLISEAVRGAGAHLVNEKGERFMRRYHPSQMELAPRDEVTRAMIQEMIANDEECLYLDLSSIPKSEGDVEQRFPNIFRVCAMHGIDLRTQRIPVVPAAHYHIGGIKVDLNGRTTLSRLYAAGEASCTGVHGANRLASTSLLECLVWGTQAGKDITARIAKSDTLTSDIRDAIRDWAVTGESQRLDRQRIAGDWSRIRTVMWNYVGIMRTKKLLDIAAKEFRLFSESFEDLYFNTRMSSELVDLFHGIQACQMIVEGAQRDPVSVGCHYLADVPTN